MLFRSDARRNLRESLELLSNKIQIQKKVNQFGSPLGKLKTESRPSIFSSLTPADGAANNDSDSSLDEIHNDPYYMQIAEELRNNLEKDKIRQYEEAEKIRNLRKINNVEDSIYSNDDNIIKNIESKSIFILNPDNILIRIWEVIIFITTLYFLTVTPITVAFSQINGEEYSIIEATLEVLFILDIPVNFCYLSSTRLILYLINPRDLYD